MYGPLTSHNEVAVDQDWAKIWRIDISERVRSFLWLLKHNRLLNFFNKSLKGLGYAACIMCGSVREDALHVFRDYTRGRQVWSNIVSDNMVNALYQLDFDAWISFNINKRSRDVCDWKSIWAMGCYFIWSWRNKEDHVDAFKRPFDPGAYMCRKVQEYVEVINMLNIFSGFFCIRINFMGWICVELVLLA